MDQNSNTVGRDRWWEQPVLAAEPSNLHIASTDGNQHFSAGVNKDISILYSQESSLYDFQFGLSSGFTGVESKNKAREVPQDFAICKCQ